MADRLVLVGETDDVFRAFADHGVDSRPFKRSLAVIAAASRNNRVGFARLGSAGQSVRVCVLPKILQEQTDTPESQLADFSDYLRHFEELKSQFPGEAGVRAKSVADATGAFARNRGAGSPGPFAALDALYSLKVADALSELRIYFQRSPETREKVERFSTFGLEGELDLAACILDPNKAQIHQTRKVPHIQADVARVCSAALSSFIHCGSAELPHLRQQAFALQGVLRRKYNLGTTARLSQLNVGAAGLAKMFQGPVRKRVLQAVYVLAGLSDFDPTDLSSGTPLFRDAESSPVRSYFLDPKTLFELSVLSGLREALPASHVVFKPARKLFKVETAQLYCGGPDWSFANAANSSSLVSEPDFLIEEPNRVVIDAKWKNFSGFNAQMFADAQKLFRDTRMYGAKAGVLVYAQAEGDTVSRAGKVTAIRFEPLQDFTCFVLALPPALPKFASARQEGQAAFAELLGLLGHV